MSRKSFIDNELLTYIKKAVKLADVPRASFLTSLGFIRQKVKGMRDVEVWINKALRIIVKRALFLGEDPPAAVRCPTKWLSRDGIRQWVVQPQVIRKRRALALEAVKARLPGDEWDHDIHIDNVGWLNGVAVAYDW